MKMDIRVRFGMMLIATWVMTWSTVQFQLNIQERISIEDAVQAVSRPLSDSPSLESDVNRGGEQQSPRDSRLLVGVFSTIYDHKIYRTNYRDLAKLSNGIMCSLNDFQSTSVDSDACRIIYTFVVAGRDKGPTKFLERNKNVAIPRPTLQGPLPPEFSDFEAQNDFTVLNIKENMEDGKSETWLNYASQVVEEIGGIDYIAKTDGDTMLYIDKFVRYLDAFLPPFPFNSNFMMGKAARKYLWKYKEKKGAIQSLKHHSDGGSELGRLQLYFQGQFYGMSPNVAAEIVQEAQFERVKAYRNGYEDADISTMAANLPHSLNYLFIKSPDLFWEHPVKLNSLGQQGFEKVWKDEFARLAIACNTTHMIGKWYHGP